MPAVARQARMSRGGREGGRRPLPNLHHGRRFEGRTKPGPGNKVLRQTMIIWELRNTVRGQTRDLPIDSLSVSPSPSLSLTIKVNLMPRVSRHGVVMTLTKGRIKFCISVPHGTVYYIVTARSAVFTAVIAVSSQVENKQWNPARIRVWTKPCRAPPHSAGPTPLQVHGGKCGRPLPVEDPPSRSDVGETRVRKARRHRGGKRNGSAATELRPFSPAVSNRGTGEGDVDGRRDGGQHFISAYSLLTSSCRSINLHAGAASGHSLRAYLGTVSTGTS